MSIKSEDIKLLCQGQPPKDYILLDKMTLDCNDWLNFIEEHYLKNYIFNGGSNMSVFCRPVLSKLNALQLELVPKWLSSRYL